MQDPQLKELFDSFNAYLDNEQELREKIRERVRGRYSGFDKFSLDVNKFLHLILLILELESNTKQAAIALQAIHSDLSLGK